jgi:hypothetical protein
LWRRDSPRNYTKDNDLIGDAQLEQHSASDAPMLSVAISIVILSVVMLIVKSSDLLRNSPTGRVFLKYITVID